MSNNKTNNNHFDYHFIDINKGFGSKALIIDCKISISNGQCTLLTGKNGTGKSTLLKILAGLEKPDTGKIIINNKTFTWSQGKSVLLKNIMYLHQHPYMFEGTVEKNLQYLIKVTRQPTENIAKAIQWAGLESIIHHNAKSLSGGEKQRVAIARAYLRNPEIVLLDEPTANLDQTAKQMTLDLLKQFQNHGTALLIATHDPDIFHALQDECLVLNNSRLSNLRPRVQTDAITDINHYRANKQ